MSETFRFQHFDKNTTTYVFHFPQSSATRNMQLAPFSSSRIRHKTNNVFGHFTITLSAVAMLITLNTSVAAGMKISVTVTMGVDVISITSRFLEGHSLWRRWHGWSGSAHGTPEEGFDGITQQHSIHNVTFVPLHLRLVFRFGFLWNLFCRSFFLDFTSSIPRVFSLGFFGDELLDCWRFLLRFLLGRCLAREAVSFRLAWFYLFARTSL